MKTLTWDDVTPEPIYLGRLATGWGMKNRRGLRRSHWHLPRAAIGVLSRAEKGKRLG